MSTNQSCSLDKKHCKPCEGGVPPLGDAEVAHFLTEVKGWKRLDKKIQKHFQFKDFVKAMEFVNNIVPVAEAEGHHPDIFIHYNQVTIDLWTHAVGGLTENDFIVAAKIDAL